MQPVKCSQLIVFNREPFSMPASGSWLPEKMVFQGSRLSEEFESIQKSSQQNTALQFSLIFIIMKRQILNVPGFKARFTKLFNRSGNRQ
jgi:hypothetical protein